MPATAVDLLTVSVCLLPMSLGRASWCFVMAGCQIGGRGLQVGLQSRQFQKLQQVPLGLLEMELGGDEGQD